MTRTFIEVPLFSKRWKEIGLGEDEDSHRGDFIKDDNVPVPADAAAFTLLKEQLEDCLLYTSLRLI